MGKRKVNELLIQRRVVIGFIGAILIICVGGLIAFNVRKNNNATGDEVPPKYTSSDEAENHFYQRYGANECKFTRIDDGADGIIPVLLSECEYENEVVSYISDEQSDDLLSTLLPRRANDINSQIKAVSSSSDGIIYVMYDGLDDKTWQTIPDFDDIRNNVVYAEIDFANVNEDRMLVQKITEICKQYFPRIQKETDNQNIASAVVFSFKDIVVQVRTGSDKIARYKPGSSLEPEEILLDDYLK